jgi:hypothetical protein
MRKNGIQITLEDLQNIDKNLRPIRNKLAHKEPKKTELVDAITAIKGTSLRAITSKLFEIEYEVAPESLF